MKEKIEIEQEKLSEKKNKVSVQEKMTQLLPNAEENLMKLQNLVENSAKRLTDLGFQWEKHRVPLIDEYRSVKDKNQNNQVRIYFNTK